MEDIHTKFLPECYLIYWHKMRGEPKKLEKLNKLSTTLKYTLYYENTRKYFFLHEGCAYVSCKKLWLIMFKKTGRSILKFKPKYDKISSRNKKNLIFPYKYKD